MGQDRGRVLRTGHWVDGLGSCSSPSNPQTGPHAPFAPRGAVFASFRTPSPFSFANLPPFYPPGSKWGEPWTLAIGAIGEGSARKVRFWPKVKVLQKVPLGRTQPLSGPFSIPPLLPPPLTFHIGDQTRASIDPNPHLPHRVGFPFPPVAHPIPGRYDHREASKHWVPWSWG